MPVEPQNPNTPDTYRQERNAAMLSLVVGAMLMTLKFAAYLLTGSSAIFSDALESIVNVIASGFALWAVKFSYQPADRTHPYGHGKIEFVSAMLEGSMILLAAVVILTQALAEFYRLTPVDHLVSGIVMVCVAMAVNGTLGLYLVFKGRRHSAIALKADGEHLLSDAVTSAAVLIALVLIKFTGWTILDPICATLVSIYVAWMGITLVRRSMAGLMDEQDPQDDHDLHALLDRHVGAGSIEPRICSYHKLRHRHTGRYHWIDFHLVVPAEWGISQAHEAASALEHEIELLLTYADATAHVEPCHAESCDRCQVAASVV
jgi:cation diffusion facilitator family transporter